MFCHQTHGEMTHMIYADQNQVESLYAREFTYFDRARGIDNKRLRSRKK